MRLPRTVGSWLSIVALAMLGTAGGLEAQDLDPSRIGWKALSYRAKKLSFAINSEIALEMASPASVVQDLRDPQQGIGLQPSSAQVALLTLGVKGLGNNSTTSLLLDAANAVAFQRRQISSGKRKRDKVLRFTDEGVQIIVVRPAQGEASDDPTTWTDGHQRFDAYPEWAGRDLRVTETTAIFYLLAASKLDRVGDEVNYPVYASDSLLLMEMSVVGTDRLKVGYTRDGQSIRGSVEALKILLDAQQLDPESDGDLELMGMRGDIEVYLDPDTRAPLQISGRVPVAGRTNVKLKRMVPR